MILRIRDILENKNISLTTLSVDSGIEKGNLSAIANGKKNPTIETLQKIAVALKVEIWELFARSSSTQELNALIEHNGVFYKATTVEELQGIVEKLKEARGE